MTNYKPMPDNVSLDLYQTAGVGVLALVLGFMLTRKMPVLKRFCIPAPVTGGLVISLLLLASYSLFGLEFSFDLTIRDICMMLFFTSVGFQSDMGALKSGGKTLVVMIILVAVLIIVQNSVSVGIARRMGLDPLMGMAAGSIPMCGGHGTAGGFAPLLESLGLSGATSITMASATFGLVAGSMIGGPLAESLIRRHRLAGDGVAEDDSGVSRNIGYHSGETSVRGYTRAVYLLLVAMAVGMCLSKLLSLTGLTFPTYFGSLIVACLIRNVCGAFGVGEGRLCLPEIVTLGSISLSVFLGIAMATLRLWELADLVLPLCIILLVQVVIMAAYAYFIAFRAMGGNYDAALLVSGLCGFGLGATPNAMANISAVCHKYRYSVKPFIIVPIIGAMFVDIINTTVITVFLNIIN